jgi:NAD(P)-dependent dehydrogenase (short-subunit alcohol dehydrogenase family)
MQDLPLKSRTAIVTGVGGDGIGLATARLLAAAGADVAVTWNKNETAIEQAAVITRTYGVKCKAIFRGVNPIYLMAIYRQGVPTRYWRPQRS